MADYHSVKQSRSDEGNRETAKKGLETVVEYDKAGSQVSDKTMQLGDLDVSYNTMSCPCSSYAIDLGDDNIGCERDYFGVIIPISPISISNHFIDNNNPKIGDKWLCTNLKCEQGDFKWDTLHVVSIKESLIKGSSSLFKSKSSTSSCYIQSILGDNFTDVRGEGLNSMREPGSIVVEPYTYVKDKPLFKTLEDYYASKEVITGHNGMVEWLEYNGGGNHGIMPGKLAGDEKIVTSITLNGKNINTLGVSDIFSSEAFRTDTLFSKNGEMFSIKIQGTNRPIFTLSLKDSSGCDILRDKQKNVVCEGSHIINQQIPALPSGVVSETYSFKMIVAADSKYYFGGEFMPLSQINLTIYQYRNPTYTFQANDSTLASVTTTSTNITFEGIASTDTSASRNFVNQTHTTTLAHGSKSLYIKNPMLSFSDVVKKGNIIKKVITREDFADTSSIQDVVVVGKAFLDADGEVVYQGDVQAGMSFESSIIKTKTIRKSIDLDIHKEPCDDCDEKQNIFTNKFEIDNTSDIFEGMTVKGKDFEGKSVSTQLESINGQREIILSDSYAMNNNTDLTFNYSIAGNVRSAIDSSKGQLIHLGPAVQLPHGSEITFEPAPTSFINGRIKHDKNGSNTVVITTTIDQIKYGQSDVTFSLNVDDFITFKPNNRDQYLIIGKNSTTNNINFTRNSGDFTRHDQTITITKQPSNGVATAAGKRYTYIPNTNFTGKDKIIFKLYDGSESSDEKTIFITVK